MVFRFCNKNDKNGYFQREDATSALASFHAGPLSRSNYNLEMLFFSGGWKTGEPGEKPSDQGENQQQTQPTYGSGPKSNGAILVGGRALSPLRQPCSPIKSL